MNCHEVEQLEDSYILGELEEDEMKRLELHLRSCTNCTRRLSEYQELLGKLFGAIQPVTPDTRVRTAVLEKTSQLPQSAPEPPRRISPRRSQWPTYYALAASFVALVLGIGVVLLALQVQSLNDQRTQAQRELDLTTSPDSLVWIMREPDAASRPDSPLAKMYARPGSPLYLVTATRLPNPAGGQQYRVWYVRDGQTALAAKLPLDPQGNARLYFNDQPAKPGRITSCFITLEDSEDNTPAPAHSPLLVWKLGNT